MDRIEKQVAREISYSYSAQTKGGRTLIRALENATGRLGLIRRARGYDDAVRAGGDFFKVLAEKYGLGLDVVDGSLANIPTEGPLIAIANHPYGILDGLMMGNILSQARGSDGFRILAHKIFRKAEDLNRIILPVNFDETKEAMRENIETRKAAIRFLSDGGAIGIFPGGTVSTAHKPFARPMDPYWRGFTAKMIAKSEAQVVPIFFDGANSRLFQLASHLHYTLRMGLLIREFRARLNTPVRVVIGEPIPRADLDPLRNDTRAMMDFLRRRTYALSPRRLDPGQIGFEFEERYRKNVGRDI